MAKKTAKKKAPAKKATTKKAATKKAATKKAAAAKDKDAPDKKKKAAPKKKKASRARAVKEIRLKAYWGVFNQSLKRVALFEFNERKLADKKAAEQKGRRSGQERQIASFCSAGERSDRRLRPFALAPAMRRIAAIFFTEDFLTADLCLL